ncbi:MAG: glycosyltransferase [Vicinamibacterales bacterium]
MSVIIPCFNLGRYVGEAIASVRSQTFVDHEVVVDDGCPTSAPTPAFATSRSPVSRCAIGGVVN